MKKLNRLQKAKLKRVDARKLIAEGKTNAEINEVIRGKYKCGDLSWGTLKELRDENTIIPPKSELEEAGQWTLNVMRAHNVIKLTIDAESGSMEIVQSETHELKLKD